ncbi:MAG: 23S rRNA (uracil(1939)-C(5))-methyltransferase RlmD [Acholeplasma sp.]|nr:23S rRNA (uracil(1939)-C(5))-methyltransferase RlmD [Acholeplasma sp.]
MFKVSDEIIVDIIDLDYKGDGIAKIDDHYIYIPGVLTGEKVKVKIIKIGKGFALGRVVEIINNSRMRVSKTSSLGSLSLSHLSFSEQLRWQEEVTIKTINKVLKGNYQSETIITDNVEYHYRNKVVFHVLDNKKIKLGLYKVNNRELEVCDNFILANLKVNKIIEEINNSNIIIDSQILKHLVFRNNEKNELLITLVSYKRKFEGMNALITVLKNNDSVKGITINIKDTKENIMGSKSYLVYGDNLLENDLLLMNDRSFMQVNYGVMKLVYQTIKKHVYGNEIIDAYSGVGSIGFSIYNSDKKILMVDNNEENTKLAQLIKDKNNFDNIDVVNGNAEDILTKINAETIIVDPPRSGLKQELIEEILLSKTNRVIYLSCDLQTLIRDLRVLTAKYEIQKIYPVKMFPQTSAFETLVVLEYLR